MALINQKVFQKIVLSFIVLITIYSCGSKDESTLSVSFVGLGDLGSEYAYEGWLIIDGIAHSAGVFNIDNQGNPFPSSFDFNERELQKATAYILTIEPSPDPDPTASSLHILAGDFYGSTADLSITHTSALATDFSTVAGSYILTTPTDDLMTNELSGIWFTSKDSLDGISLSLPRLPSNWIYESWAIIDDVPLSMGKFNKVDSADRAQPYSGSNFGFNFPGEDFLQNAPSGISFPTNLSRSTIAITVEPIPDNSNEPFSIAPLVSTIDSLAVEGRSYLLNNNVLNGIPTGTITR